MKPGPFRYHAPRALDEAIGLLSECDNAKLLAGGQSLMAMLNLRYAMPDDVIDINGLPGLAGISVTGDAIKIASMTRQRVIERDAALGQAAPIFADALRHVGHMQTRNRGTIGGSLCHLDPAAELVALCMLYDATLTVSGRAGERRLPMAEFPAFYMTPSLTSDEILTRITLPRWAGTHGHGFVEFARRHGDFAIIAVGVLLALDPTGDVARCAIVIGGAGAAPLRLTTAEAQLIGHRPDPDTLEQATATAREIEAMDDSAYSADYRRHLAGVLTGRALRQAVERAA